jgi:hypothetical protein
VAAPHDTTEPVVAEGVHVIVIFHCMTTSASAGIAEGGERADSHAKGGCAIEGLVVQADGGGVGDDVELHAARPAENARQDGLVGRLAKGASALREGAADECGQQS